MFDLIICHWAKKNKRKTNHTIKKLVWNNSQWSWRVRPAGGAVCTVSVRVREHVNTWPLQGTEPADCCNKESPLQSPPADRRGMFPLSRMADEETFALEDQTVNRVLSLRDYRRLTRLYCMNGGHHLQILPDGTVQGQRDDRDVHSKTAACSVMCSRPFPVGVSCVQPLTIP